MKILPFATILLVVLSIKSNVFANINLYLTQQDDGFINASCIDTRPCINSALLLINSTNNNVDIVNDAISHISPRSSNLTCRYNECITNITSNEMGKRNDMELKDSEIYTTENDNEETINNLPEEKEFYISILGDDVSFYLKPKVNISVINNCSSAVSLSNKGIIFNDYVGNKSENRELQDVISFSKWRTFQYEHFKYNNIEYNRLKSDGELLLSVENDHINSAFFSLKNYSLVLKSKKKTFWIIHTKMVLRINKKRTSAITKKFEVYRDRLCVMFRLKMNFKCLFKVTAERNNKNFTKTISITEGWKDVKIEYYFPDLNKSNVKLIFEPIIEMSDKTDIAISDLQECIKDYRSINAILQPTTTNISCQKLNTHYFASNTSIRSISKCAPGYFGQYCDISCGGYFGKQHEHCKGVLMCEKGSCKCAAGYTGEYCQQKDAFDLYNLLYLLVIIPILIILLCFLYLTRKKNYMPKRILDSQRIVSTYVENQIYDSAENNEYSIIN